MNAIKVLRGCGASGQSLQAGVIYAVPDAVSEKDAALLIRLGKAEAAETEAAPAPQARRKKSDE